MTQRKAIGCVVAVLGAALLLFTLPLGVFGLAWLFYDLVRGDYIPRWFVSLAGASAAVCLPSLALFIIAMGLVVLYSGRIGRAR